MMEKIGKGEGVDLPLMFPEIASYFSPNRSPISVTLHRQLF